MLVKLSYGVKVYIQVMFSLNLATFWRLARVGRWL